MVMCVVGNRGGERAAMLRGWVATVFCGFGTQEGTHGPSVGKNLRNCCCISRCEPFSVFAPDGMGAAA